MVYLFGLAANAIIATLVAALASIVAAALPVRFGSRLGRGAAVFAILWLGLMTYGCVELFRTHHVELSKDEGAEILPGLVGSSGQVVQAVRIYGGDTSQRYLLLNVTKERVEAMARASGMDKGPFDAHTAKARGWETPEWWPTTPCADGVTYQGDGFGNPQSRLDYVINWCPAESRAYVQVFDY